MPTEVVSPISRKGSKAGSSPPRMGINRNPDRGDSVPQQATRGTASRHSAGELPQASLEVTGPQDE